jgi:hypothetical protein
LLSVVKFLASCSVVRGFVGWRIAVYTHRYSTQRLRPSMSPSRCIYLALYVVLVSYRLSYFIMEPTFSSAASVTTVTPVLAAQIQAATAALPAAHRVAPQEREIVESKDTAFLRLQNWAFTQGFALATESTKPKRVVFHCTHHKKTTKNCRKTAEANRQRVQTQTQARGCQFSLYISKTQRADGQWSIGSTCLHHNYAPNPDPFQYIQH